MYHTYTAHVHVTKRLQICIYVTYAGRLTRLIGSSHQDTRTCTHARACTHAHTHMHTHTALSCFIIYHTLSCFVSFFNQFATYTHCLQHRSVVEMYIYLYECAGICTHTCRTVTLVKGVEDFLIEINIYRHIHINMYEYV